MNGEAESRLTKEDLEQMLSTAISDFQVTNLTEPGDNNGSIMLSVNVTLRTGKTIYLVAKTYPTDPLTIQVFNSPISMRKEIDVYVVLVPEFQRIQEDHTVPPPQRLDVFCTCVAARATRRGDDGTRPADENSVILMENLKAQGYASADRVSGMDLAHTQFVVSQLAKFHATAIAIKMNKPLLFRNKITKILTPIKVKAGRQFEEDMTNSYLEQLVRRSPVCEERVEKLTKRMKEDLEYKFSEEYRLPVEPFATVVHNDLWTNNIMFRYRSPTSNDSKPISVKFIDFQLPSYGSPAADILFFIFTSSKEEVIEENLDSLLRLYHDNFVQWLSLLGCSTRKFSWDSFTKELDIFAGLELPHILGMLNIVMAHKDELESLANGPQENNHPSIEINDDIVQRASQIVSIYSEKGWL